jgi:hypothetical protein
VAHFDNWNLLDPFWEMEVLLELGKLEGAMITQVMKEEPQVELFMSAEAQGMILFRVYANEVHICTCWLESLDVYVRIQC